MPFRYDYRARRGAPFHDAITVLVDDETPYDLTGYSAVLHIFDAASDAPRVSALATIDGPKGTFWLDLDASAVASVTEGSRYRLDLTTPEGETEAMQVGAFLVA